MRLQDKTKIRLSAVWRRRWVVVLKAAFAVLLGWMLYRHTSSAPEGLDWGLVFDAGRMRSAWYWPAAAALLVPVNWALETLKWSSFLRFFAPATPFMQKYAAVVAGVAISLFTPNRIGEYVGRILAFDKSAAWGVALSSVLGSLCQWIVLLAGGAIGAYVVAARFTDAPSFLSGSFLALGLGFAAVLVFGMFNVRSAAGVARLLPRGRLRLGLMRRLAALRRCESRAVAAALAWAALRYAVYCSQYYLMLRFFGIAVPPGLAAAGISTIFLAQTSLPLPPLAGLLARGELAIAVWGYFSSDTAAILAAAYSLFILNLSLPSLVGAWIILRSTWIKTTSR